RAFARPDDARPSVISNYGVRAAHASPPPASARIAAPRCAARLRALVAVAAHACTVHKGSPLSTAVPAAGRSAVHDGQSNAGKTGMLRSAWMMADALARS